MKLFVYGSLMKKMESHELLEDAELLYAPCETADMLSMYIHEDYPFVFGGRAKYPIKGELYEVSHALLKKLSEYEGEFYYLTVTDVICGENVVNAYIYMGKGHFFGMKEVSDGDYRRFIGE